MTGQGDDLYAKLLAERGPVLKDLCGLCGGVFPRSDLQGRFGRPGVRMCPGCAEHDPNEVLDAIENDRQQRYG